MPRLLDETKSAAYTIFVAASNLVEGGKIEFTEFDLTVSAWQVDPKRYGMPGYPQHPDHKRAYAELLKKLKPFVKRVRANTYTLTEAGWIRHWQLRRKIKTKNHDSP